MAKCWLRWLITGNWHRLYVVQEFSSMTSRRVACASCKGDWAMNDSQQAFLPWDTEIENILRDCGFVIVQPWR